MTKINLGAGRWKLEGKGWTTVDADSRSTPNIVHDLTVVPYPFKENTADFIYASHIIEHLTYEKAQQLFRESLRILAPGGVLRIVTPDYRTAFTKYIEGKFVEWFTGIMDGDKSWPKKSYYTDLLALTEEFIYAGAPNPLGHKSIWDIETILFLLKKAGYTETYQSNYNKSVYPELKGIDNRPELSIYVEGKR